MAIEEEEESDARRGACRRRRGRCRPACRAGPRRTPSGRPGRGTYPARRRGEGQVESLSSAGGELSATHLGLDGRLERERGAELADEAAGAHDERRSLDALALTEERARRDDAGEAADERAGRGASRIAEDEGAAHRVTCARGPGSAVLRLDGGGEGAHRRGRRGRRGTGRGRARGSGRCRRTARART